jgi:galactokinase/mevalonate kinase-like predicted kinase
MIISRSPLRITLGGGGTDLPSYYRRHSGFLLAAAIDKYVYITLHTTFAQGLIIKYSNMEHVNTVQEVQHPIIREALQMLEIEPMLEITSMADIPAGTGLGSSGSFTTALLKSLHTSQNRGRSPPGRWPSKPARSSSTDSRSRLASRTSTSRHTVASPLSSSWLTTGSRSGR